MTSVSAFKDDKIGGTEPAVNKFREIFRTLDKDLKFEVSYSGRVSKPYADQFHSHQIVQDAVLKSEIEGGALLRLLENKKINGVVSVKGIIDNGEESQISNLKWKYTAALAALHYAQSVLYGYKSQGMAN